METKVCFHCKEEKPITSFHKKKEVRNGKVFNYTDHRCRPCHSHVASLTQRMNKGFNTLKPDACECCGEAGVPLSVDHNHQNNQFRGFICRSCNVTLHRLGDTFESVMASDCLRIYKDYMKMANFRQGEAVRK